MKRLIALLISLTLVISVSAQVRDTVPVFETGILGLTGEQWINTSQDTKEGFAIGYMFGLNLLYRLAQDMIDSDTFTETVIADYGVEGFDSAYELLNLMKSWAWYDVTFMGIVEKLDKVYANPANRHYSIFEVLLVEYDKNWWTTD